MKTISLRFAENFSPPCGTIKAHQEMIDEIGFVWFGKLGNKISKKAANEILKSKEPKILLIRSSSTERYWALIDQISFETPDLENIPAYYRNIADRFKTWFRVIGIEKAEKDIMSKFIVSSSKEPLSYASKHSMSPYFIIESNFKEEEN